MMNRLSIFLCIAIAFGFSCCATVGPDYTEPEFPDANYSDVLQPGAAARGHLTPETLSQWWDTLDDPLLTELIEQAVANNLDMQEARAKVLEARYQLSISRSGLFPMLDASGNYTKTKSSENTSFRLGERDTYQAGFDAGWEIDVFGGVRREIEAAQADLQAEEESMHSIWVTLAGDVAINYVSLRTLQKRLQVAEDNLTNQNESHEILVSSYEAGLSNELPVQQSRYILEQTRSTIPTIRSAIESTQNALALLTGVIPGTLHEKLQTAKPIPKSSIGMVTGIPADALRQRPDIRMAERELAAQTARIGQAQALLYPKFTLFGSIGLDALDAGDFFDARSKTWSFGPSVSWPVFRAGSIRNNVKVQSARQEQYLARYEKAILAAVKEVRDALVDYAQEQERYESLSAAAKAAEVAVEVSQDQYKSGLVDFYNVLDAQRSLLTFQDQLAASEGMITSNLVRIYKALGGGWQPMQTEKEE